MKSDEETALVFRMRELAARAVANERALTALATRGYENAFGELAARASANAQDFSSLISQCADILVTLTVQEETKVRQSSLPSHPPIRRVVSRGRSH